MSAHSSYLDIPKWTSNLAKDFHSVCALDSVSEFNLCSSLKLKSTLMREILWDVDAKTGSLISKAIFAFIIRSGSSRAHCRNFRRINYLCRRELYENGMRIIIAAETLRV